MNNDLREPLSVGAPKTNGSGLAISGSGEVASRMAHNHEIAGSIPASPIDPILVNVTDPETRVEYVLCVQLNRWGGIGLVGIESARLWIGKTGFDIDLVQDDHRATERAGDFIRRKLMPQIMEALQCSTEAEALIVPE